MHHSSELRGDLLERAQKAAKAKRNSTSRIRPISATRKEGRRDKQQRGNERIEKEASH